MKYEKKDIIATVYLKDGNLVSGFKDHTPIGDLAPTIRSFHDNGIDKIVLYDLSDGDEEHEKNLHAMKEITHIAEIPVYAGGNINRLEDIKKILYAGCRKAVLNAQKEQTPELVHEGAMRFGASRMALSIFDVDMFFKDKDAVEASISELFVLDPHMAGTIGNVTQKPYTVLLPELTKENALLYLKKEDTIRGVSGQTLCRHPQIVPELKEYLRSAGISTDHLSASMEWSAFKVGENGLLPVVTQDVTTNEVLMLAYMNEEAYKKTLETGRMTYYSRSRQELWVKGETSGNFQYVKSLSIDCDRDTLLARVSPAGPACHTGNRTCFYTEIAREDYTEKQLSGVLRHEYNVIKDRKEHPKEGSYTNYLFDKGLDKILKKVGEEATEIVIAAKNPQKEEIKYEVADFLYHMLVMMVEREVTLEEVLEEVAMR